MKKAQIPCIQTERLLLRRFTTDDLDSYLTIMSDEETNKYLPWFPIKTADEAQAHLEKHFLSFYDKPSVCRYAVCFKSDNIPIGYVTLAANESHDFGYGLRKEFWRRGIITEAAQAAVTHIQKTDIPFITATHDVHNSASGVVMQKIGMSYRYSYVENCQPKNTLVTFRLYQLDFIKNVPTYNEYRNKYKNHFIELER